MIVFLCPFISNVANLPSIELYSQKKGAYLLPSCVFDVSWTRTMVPACNHSEWLHTVQTLIRAQLITRLRPCANRLHAASSLHEQLTTFDSAATPDLTMHGSMSQLGVCVPVSVCAWAAARHWHCDSDMTACNCLLHSNQRGVNNAASLGFLPSPRSVGLHQRLRHLDGPQQQPYTGSDTHTQRNTQGNTHRQTQADDMLRFCKGEKKLIVKESGPTLKVFFFCISGRLKRQLGCWCTLAGHPL